MPEPRDKDAEVLEVDLDPRARAVRRLRKQREFRQHLTAYVVVNALFITIWAMTGPPNDSWFPWFLIPLIGWGIGIIFHAMDAYGHEITEADIEREMAREQERRAA